MFPTKNIRGVAYLVTGSIDLIANPRQGRRVWVGMASTGISLSNDDFCASPTPQNILRKPLLNKPGTAHIVVLAPFSN